MNIYVLIIKVENDTHDINFYNTSMHYSLNEAINHGKITLKNICLDYNDIEEISDKELDKFYSDNIYYEFQISIISGNRKRFNDSNEIMKYFNENIKNISKENLYNFLLELVESDNRYYDYSGKLINSEPIPQNFKLEPICGSVIDFSIESCNLEGYYRFYYN